MKNRARKASNGKKGIKTKSILPADVSREKFTAEAPHGAGGGEQARKCRRCVV